jgi:alkylated DNA repair dioxygenase AlkB
MAAQPDLFAETKGPPGFVYRPEVLGVEEEAALASWLATLDFQPFEFRGFSGRRHVVSFGWRYDFNSARLQEAADIPAELLPARAKAAALAGLRPEALQQVLINQYPPGAPIGWHRDRPAFAEVVGLSLLAPCTLRLRRRTPGGFERHAVTLEPRSAYVLTGPAREAWEHSIPPVAALRYSITFRSFRPGRAP